MNGVIRRRHFTEGSYVRQGQPLYVTADGEVRWGRNRRDGAAGERNSPSNPNRPLPEGPVSDSRLATAAELEGLHEHLERLLTESEFLHPAHQKQVKLKLRRIFHKATLEENELNILRGALTSLDPAKRHARKRHD